MTGLRVIPILVVLSAALMVGLSVFLVLPGRREGLGRRASGPVDDYLRQLAASLRTPPPQTSRILAEAEDHLRESMAAALAAGRTEIEAAEAAISSFGSVRAVVRAHQTWRGEAAAVLARLAMTGRGPVGVVLMSLFAVAMMMLVVGLATGLQLSSRASSGHQGKPAAAVADRDSDWRAHLMVDSGPGGVVVLGGYLVARRRLRARRAISRGTILAGTFASLVLGGIGFLTQVGLAVTAGVVIAAFVMSVLLVRSLTALLGRAAWRPGSTGERLR